MITFEETAETLLTGDLDTTKEIIPYLVHANISIGFAYSLAFRQAVFETDRLIGVEGNKLVVPVLGRGEFECKTISEADLDNNGYVKTKLSPDSVKITIEDIYYNATKISDVLLEDSPSLNWLQASLLKMTEAVGLKIDTFIRDKLIDEAGTTVNAGTPATLKYEDIINLKTEMLKKSVDFTAGPTFLFVHPDQYKDLMHRIITSGSQSDVFTPLERFSTDQPTVPQMVGMYAGCQLIVTENMTAGKALLVQKTPEPRGPPALLAWKRRFKTESWRGDEGQYGRTCWLLSCRFGCEVVQSSLVGLIDNC